MIDTNKATMMLAGLFLTLAATTQTFAGDFSAGSQAKKWGLTGEETALFSGRVVDVLCELSGDCPDKCGDGKRHLGIVRAGDNKLIIVTKNSQPAFNGAAEDLLPYCGKDVDVDGVLVGDDKGIDAKVFLVQLIRNKGEDKWHKANRWTKVWQDKNPDSKGKGPWFRRDPRVAEQIKKDGYLGLGLDVDKKYIAEELE